MAHDFDMHQPSVNKWSTPIVGLQRKPIKDENANNEDMQAKMKKYDPCVSFQAGTPIISSEMKFSVTVKTSRSNSNSSSGNSTPGRGLSGSSSPPSRRKKSSNSNSIPEPCVTFVSGRPVISSAEETVDQIDSTGVSASSLNYALKRQLNSSSETESTRRPKGKMPSSKQPYDKEAREVASLGMVSRLKDTFNDDQSKRSAISVLREDFRDQPGSPESDIENGEVSPESRFHLSINVSEGKGQMQRPNRTYSRNLISRSQRGRVGNLSSLTSQATLIESKAGNRLPMSPVGPRRGGSIHSNSVSSVTPVSGKGNVTRNKIRRVSEDKDSRIGFVVASGDGSQRVVGLPITLTHGPRPTKVSSSSDLSDDDSAVEYGKEVSGQCTQCFCNFSCYRDFFVIVLSCFS